MLQSREGGPTSPHKCIFCNKYFAREVIDQHANRCLDQSQNVKHEDLPLTPSSANTSFSSVTGNSATIDLSQGKGIRSSQTQSATKSKKNNKRSPAIGNLISNSNKKLKSSSNSELTNAGSNVRQTKLPFYQDTAQFNSEEAANIKNRTRQWQMDSGQILDEKDTAEIRGAQDKQQLQPMLSGAKKDKRKSFSPLADKIRPSTLTGYVGQKNVIGNKSMLRSLIESADVPSMVLWGPPGCGKTTLANIIAECGKSKAGVRFIQLSATASGTAKVREVIDIAKKDRTMFNRQTILFMDEIHRFNKAQQDVFLPYVEDGTIVLIGATTENPSFSLNNALLSRCRVIVLEKLSSTDVQSILNKAVQDIATYLDLDDAQCGARYRIELEEGAITTLANSCDGDARIALNSLEIAIRSKVADRVNDDLAPSKTNQQIFEDLDKMNNDDNRDIKKEVSTVKELYSRLSGIQEGLEHILKQESVSEEDKKNQDKSHEIIITDDEVRSTTVNANAKVAPLTVIITEKDVIESLQRSHLQYDRQGDEHYNIISALHKSMRGSNENAALYWLGRMLQGGEQPSYIARRLIRFASEDVGLADSQALCIAVATYQACQFIGMPECEVNLAQAVIYLSRAPKSIECYTAYGKVKKNIDGWKGPLPSVPLHLRNAPTVLLKRLGYGKDYKYNPDYDGVAEQDYLPDCLLNVNFFKD